MLSGGRSAQVQFGSACLGVPWQVTALNCRTRAGSMVMPTPACHLLLGADMAIPICPPYLSQAYWGHTSSGCTNLLLRPTAHVQ